MGHFKNEVEPFARMLAGRHFPEEGDILAKRAEEIQRRYVENSE